MRTFEYRLYPNTAQSHLLMMCLSESRQLYHEMLERVKAQYAENGTFPTKYDLTAQFKGRGGEHVSATTVQMLADRLTKSLKRLPVARHTPISRSPVNAETFSIRQPNTMPNSTR